MEIPVKVKRLAKDLPLPKYMSNQAAGMDLFAAVDSELTILPGHSAVVPSGIAISLPEGYEAQVRPRSGLAAKHGISVVNSPGTIDADYRGQIFVILINHGKEDFKIKRGERIAQMVLNQVPRIQFSEVEELDETKRGSGGHGSTGR